VALLLGRGVSGSPAGFDLISQSATPADFLRALLRASIPFEKTS